MATEDERNPSTFREETSQELHELRSTVSSLQILVETRLAVQTANTKWLIVIGLLILATLGYTNFVRIPAEASAKAKDAVSGAVDAAVDKAVPSEVSTAVPLAVSSQLQRIVPEQINRSLAETLPKTVEESISDALPREVDEKLTRSVPKEVRNQLPTQIKRELDQVLSAAVTREVDSKVEAAVSSRVEERLAVLVPKEVHKTLADSVSSEVRRQMHSAIPETLNQMLPNAVASRIEETLPTAVTAAVDDKVASAVPLAVEERVGPKTLESVDALMVKLKSTVRESQKEHTRITGLLAEVSDLEAAFSNIARNTVMRELHLLGVELDSSPAGIAARAQVNDQANFETICHHLTELPGVTSVTIEGSVTTLEPLTRLSELASLSIVGGESELDLDPLRALKSLKTITFSRYKLKDLSPLAAMPSLDQWSGADCRASLQSDSQGVEAQIHFFGNRSLARLTSEYLCHLPGLSAVRISGSCTSLEPLCQLKGLKRVNCPLDKLDISPLLHCIELERLGLKDTDVRFYGQTPSATYSGRDKQALEKIIYSCLNPARIRGLTLENGNSLEPFECLEELPDLETLTIKGSSRIPDWIQSKRTREPLNLSGLTRLKTLRKLRVEGRANYSILERSPGLDELEIVDAEVRSTDFVGFTQLSTLRFVDCDIDAAELKKIRVSLPTTIVTDS